MENNQANEIRQKLTKTILVGLPAVGKTTLSKEIARLAEEKTGEKFETVSSDMEFRAVRKNKNHSITQKFMKENNIPDEDFPLLIKTNDFIAKYGEPLFRDLESAVVTNMLERGEFDGKIPNLGGKAMLHEKTATAFKQKGYQVVYLQADLPTIADHIVKDFEAMLDGATITRSPTNGPIQQDLREKFPDIADKSTNEILRERRENLRNAIKSSNSLKSVQKFNSQRKEDLKELTERNKELNHKALEVIAKRHIEGDPLYEKVADKSVFLSGEIKDDVAMLCSAVGIEDLSGKAHESDNYTNSIRALIPGIDEVLPHTYDDEQNNEFRKYFDPIIEQILNEAPTSDNPKLVHMLGIPGAGKTTYYRNHKDKYKDYVLIGFDLIMERVPEYHQDRLKLGKMEAFKKWELPARKAGYETLRRAVEQRKNIFFDHGGTPVCHRELLANLRKMGYEITMFFLDCGAYKKSDILRIYKERIVPRPRGLPWTTYAGRDKPVKAAKKYYEEEAKKDRGFNYIKINSKGNKR